MVTLAVIFCVATIHFALKIAGWLLWVLFGFIHALLRH